MTTKVKVGTKKYNVNGTEVEYKTAEGTMKESVQEVTFANKTSACSRRN